MTEQTLYELKHFQTGESVYWTLAQIWEEVNRDHSPKWSDYNKNFWKSALEDFTEWRFVSEFPKEKSLIERLTERHAKTLRILENGSPYMSNRVALDCLCPDDDDFFTFFAGNKKEIRTVSRKNHSNSLATHMPDLRWDD